MANLYELDAMIESLLEQEDPETGELLSDMEQLEAVLMERDTKIENIALYIKNKTAEAEAIKAEKLALEKRQKSAAILDDTFFNDPANERFLRYKLPEADKTAIKNALKAGETVPGAELVSKMNMILK